MNVAISTDETYTEFDGKILVDSLSRDKASAKACFIHQQFQGLVTSEYFPCVGAKSAFQRRSYRFGVFGDLASPDTTRPLLRALSRFMAEQPSLDPQYSTFVAVFDGAPVAAEEQFEARLWTQLQYLNDLDAEAHAWSPLRSADPDDPQFAYSIGGKAYFLVGLNPAASRWSRRFAWPALIFNAHDQFERLRDSNRFARMQDVIKSRDATLQGYANPEALNFGVKSEARQYSGRAVPEDWRCPFTARQTVMAAPAVSPADPAEA